MCGEHAFVAIREHMANSGRGRCKALSRGSRCENVWHSGDWVGAIRLRIKLSPALERVMRVLPQSRIRDVCQVSYTRNATHTSFPRAFSPPQFGAGVGHFHAPKLKLF